jgi:hypothetical protein
MKTKVLSSIRGMKVGSIFGFYLVVLLIGYIILNKGFAYIGIGKLYISEIGIALGILTAVILWFRRELFWKRLKQPSVILLLTFMAWGFARTLPYLRIDGINAIRDAMLWGYGIYGLLICLVLPRNYVEQFIKIYNRAIPFILVWLPIAFILYWYAGVQLSLFGAPVPLLALKTGDVCVHLGAIAAFLLLRLDKSDRPYSNWMRTGMWILWWISWVLYGTSTRAGMFSSLIGMAAVVFVRPKSDWIRPLVSGAVVIGFLIVSGLNIHVPDTTRNVSISFYQIRINFLSLSGIGGDEISIQPQPTPTGQPSTTVPTPNPGVVNPTPNPGIVNPTPNPDLRIGTMLWRFDWWKKIVDYTFKGPYFWTGKGYGINLADDDGFQVMPDHSLRSPHNAFMTVLARSGVPGLVLWLAFLGVLFFQAARMIYARPPRPDRLLIGWVTIYTLVLLFNACFDVFLEGPMGGIWFWSMAGILLVCSQERD